MVKAKVKKEEQTLLLENILNSSISGSYSLKAVYDNKHRIIDFIITYVNNIFCEMSRKSKHELLGKSYLALFPHTLASGVFDRNCKILKNGKGTRQEIHYAGDGVDGWYDSYVTKAGEDTLVISFNDITVLKKTAVQLELSNQQLIISNERLLEFTQIASHDLNEPLRKVLTYSELLNDRYGDKLEFAARDYLIRIQKTARRMQVLIDDLLAFSQVTNSTQKFGKVSLSGIVHEVLNDLETSISQTHAQIKISALPTIKGDKTQVRQIFQNLISNAIKFQDPKSTPVIQIESKGEVTRNFQEISGDFYLIEIRDNGIGFEQSQAEKIFQLFKRLHGKGEFEGSGIGLAIVQKAMENHHGFVNVESEPEKGSCFQLFFPKPGNGVRVRRSRSLIR
ncbi:MAG: ATP-binding protein [Cyclobacteriaceae bacterium]